MSQDLSFSVERLTRAASEVEQTSDPLGQAAAAIVAPPASAFGELLSTATAFSYPAASDGAKHFLEALADGTGQIGAGLGDTAGRYRSTEQANVEQAKSIMAGAN